MIDKENSFEKDINVPHKEQIMIDGVDVSECIYLYSRWPNSLPHEACGLFHSDSPYDDDNRYLCKYNPDCYFKQLACKTQECEELKNKLNEYEKPGGALDEGEAWFNLAQEYEQALNYIEECINELDWTMFGCTYKRINDIIIKVKGEQ